MKKKFYGFIIILFFSCSTQKTTESISKETLKNSFVFDYAGKLNQKQFDFIKTTYQWNNEKILIINFRQPKSFCHFDHCEHYLKGNKWWRDFYSKVALESCQNLFVFSDKFRLDINIDDKNNFEDKNSFLLTNFFKKKKSCFGVMVLNERGGYFQFNGDYSQKQVASFIENLK